MAIVDLQRGIQEAGRIRIGQQVPAGQGRTRPAKLDTFRLTSSDRRRIDQAAQLYGGTVSEWQAPSGKQWQVITATDSLDVIVPPSDLSFSQHYELWSAGGCQRRCDGVTESIGEQPCVCDPGGRECDIHTRLSVMLRDLPGLGVWRIDTQGYYAAIELSGAVQIIQMAAGHGALLPARLRLEQRSVKRPDANGKPQTLRFAVPVLDIDISPAQLLGGRAEAQPLELVTQPRPALTPVPALAGPGPSIAEQSAPPAARPPRKNAAPEIPSSGRSRRTPQQPARPEPATAGEQPATDVLPPRPSPATEQPERPSSGATAAAGGDGARTDSPAVVQPDRSSVEYWRARAHAAADDRYMDHRALHRVAAAVLGIDPADDAAGRFSMSDMSVPDYEAVVAAVERIAAKPTIESAELVAANAMATAQLLNGLDDEAMWRRIDTIAAAVLGSEPEGAGDWIELALRIGAGERPDAPERPADRAAAGGTCRAHGLPWSAVEAGTDARGRRVAAHWVCSIAACGNRPTKRWADANPIGEAVPA